MRLTGAGALLVLLALNPRLQPQPVGPSQPITVGRNVQVSQARSKQDHFEIRLAIDPDRPRHMLACSKVVPQAPSDRGFDVIAYQSTNGGLSWRPSLEPGFGALVTDPDCAYALDGSALVAAIVIDKMAVEKRFEQAWSASLVTYRSADGGENWSGPTLVSSGGTVDREFITVDRSQGRHRGRVYINGKTAPRYLDDTGSGPAVTYAVALFRSLDQGLTFQSPASRQGSSTRAIWTTGNGAVLSDGTLVFPSQDVAAADRSSILTVSRERNPDARQSSLSLVTSSDGGATLSQSIPIQAISLCGELDMPTLAVDSSQGPFRDRIYVTWPDFRSGTCQILLTWSSNKGKTWSRPVAVSDVDASRAASNNLPEVFLPALAVNGRGVVGVAWYDRREHPEQAGWTMRFSASLDGGETFLPSVRISEGATAFGEYARDLLDVRITGGGTRPAEFGGGDLKFSVGYNQRHALRGGDTSGMAAEGDAFYPLWVDNRTSVFQLWTARVAVGGAAERNGDASLATLDDISERVTLQFGRPRFNDVSHILIVESYLVNTSAAPVTGPVRMRVMALDSAIGKASILHAANGLSATGAVVDFADALENGRLDPGARSKPKTLEFQLEDMRPLLASGREGWDAATANQMLSGLVRLEVKMLGAGAKAR